MKRNGRSRSGVEAKRRRARIARRLDFVRRKLERAVMANAMAVVARALRRRLAASPGETLTFDPEMGMMFGNMPKPGDTWEVKSADGATFKFKMVDENNPDVTVTMPAMASQITCEIGFTNPDPVPPAQLALYEHMAYLSSEHWCAGWMDRLGETLQGIIDRDNHHPAGYVAFTVEEFEKLKRLRAEAGGWWVWDDAVVDGPEGDCVRFVPDVAK